MEAVLQSREHKRMIQQRDINIHCRGEEMAKFTKGKIFKVLCVVFAQIIIVMALTLFQGSGLNFENSHTTIK